MIVYARYVRERDRSATGSGGLCVGFAPARLSAPVEPFSIGAERRNRDASPSGAGRPSIRRWRAYSG